MYIYLKKQNIKGIVTALGFLFTFNYYYYYHLLHFIPFLVFLQSFLCLTVFCILLFLSTRALNIRKNYSHMGISLHPFYIEHSHSHYVISTLYQITFVYRFSVLYRVFFLFLWVHASEFDFACNHCVLSTALQAVWEFC